MSSYDRTKYFFKMLQLLVFGYSASLSESHRTIWNFEVFAFVQQCLVKL